MKNKWIWRALALFLLALLCLGTAVACKDKTPDEPDNGQPSGPVQEWPDDGELKTI